MSTSPQSFLETKTSPTVLLADDDESLNFILAQALKKHGFRVLSTSRGDELLEWAEEGKGDLVITDVIMPGLDGLEALRRIRSTNKYLPVIVISAQNSLMTAVKATEAGANEYLPKPFDLEELLSTAKRLTENAYERATPHDTKETPLIIGSSPAMQSLYKTLARLVPVDLTVLIEGESGTGKEVVARTLHQLGPRRDKSFIALNMAAIPQELVESELFGHEKGAFTGAIARKSGVFAQAQGGTLFLDEIGDMPMEAQSKLLRVLQDQHYTPVGSTRAEKTNARIICASHHNLQKLVAEKKFREDLFYRLNVVPLAIPPLRERREDIAELADYFLKQSRAKGLGEKRLSEEALTLLMQYRWPGNVRELEHLIYRLAALTAEKVIHRDTVASQLVPLQDSAQPTFTSSFREHVHQLLKQYFDAHKPHLPPQGLYDRVLEQMEYPLLLLTLKATRGNQLKAAKLLGINRNTLRKKITDLGITTDDIRHSS
ncbi:MAG: nitrogen regulation protein NR(I) [Rickettsiales bacterium]